MSGFARHGWFMVAIAGIALVAGVAISAAAVFGTSAVARPEIASARAKLTSFGSCDPLRSYLQRHRRAVRSGPLGPMPVAEDLLAAAPAPGGEAMEAPGGSTNVQEAGVDEPDIVKAAGSTIFALDGDRLRAVSTVDGVPVVLDSIELPNGPGPEAFADERQLLLAGERALVISRSYAADAYVPRTLLTELDISDPAAIRELATMKVEGDYVSARLTGATARVVISAYPELPVADSGHGRAWLPRGVLHDRTAGTSRASLFGCDDVRRPRRFSGAEMLSVLTIDLERGLPAVDADAVMTAGETVYASPTSLYVATERWRGNGAGAGTESVVRTEIHRFDTSDPVLTEYAGSGAVDGHMLSQWSMSEHEGVLRVASTSVPPGLGTEAEANQSYVTTLVPEGRRLVEAGRLAGIGRGEQIYAVRFIGDSGYVVTFRQVDPLHVIDVSDPTQPRLAGELEIPGYSAYLHPVGPGLLLGIGQDANADGATKGAQASLFDVSDPANPVRIDHVTLGRGSSTEVEYDHHAFGWSPEHGVAVVPIGSWRGPGFHGAVGVRAGVAGLELTKRTTHGGSWESAIRRSLAIGELLYTVSAKGVAVHDPATLERLALTRFAGA